MNKFIVFVFLIHSSQVLANRIDQFNKKIHRNFIKKAKFEVEVNAVNKHLGKTKEFTIEISNNSLERFIPSFKNENVIEEINLKTKYLYGLNFDELFSDYKVSYKGDYYSALDLSGEKEVTEYLIYMNAKKITKVIMKRAIGTTTFYYRWSYNKKIKKYYPNRIKIKSFEGVYNKVKEINLSYSTRGGIFYPSYISEISSLHLISAKQNKKISKSYVGWTRFRKTL